MNYAYKLEQLYVDQDPDFVHETLAPLISWLDPNDDERIHHFELREHSPGAITAHQLIVSWNLEQLEKQRPVLIDDIRRYRAKRTVAAEHEPEFAAYGLALVAISCLLKRRVVDVRRWNPPDLLLDKTIGKLRGVEVAGRSSRGFAALTQALEGSGDQPGKRAQLLSRVDVIEAYVSLWCCAPRVSMWEKIKP